MSAAALLHTREQFSLVANAPFPIAWPLFGANNERAWAPDWEPLFLWPEKAFDQEGMVFRVGHGQKTATWVNTAFDRMARRIQYVYVIPDVVVTVITLKLTPNRRSTTVDVVYERTALADAANEVVKDMAARDRIAGPDWSRQISGSLSFFSDCPIDEFAIEVQRHGPAKNTNKKDRIW
jgi:hypothetical protein